LKVDLVLKNLRAYVDGDLLDCCIAIENGKIFKVGREAQMPSADMVIDLNGLIVLPGLIDAHVHLRDEGKSYKEDFYSGTAAAAAGGITTVIDMPNNQPVTMSAETLRKRMQMAERRALVNVGFYSEFPRKSSEIDEIILEGAIGFKLFMNTQMGGLNVDDDYAVIEAFRHVASKVPIAVHAEDKQIIAAIEGSLKGQGRCDLEAFIQAHPEEAEIKAVKRIIAIAKETGSHLHLCHVSTGATIELISEARSRGQKISCEVTPHHILLSVEDLRRIGSFAVTLPPLRDKCHILLLWKGIREGIVDIIASDHAPHTLMEKQSSNIWYVKAGIPGLETMLPLMLTEVNNGRLSIRELVKLMAENPAKIFGLRSIGYIREGMNADLVVVDLKSEGKIDSSKFKSKARFSPFDGWEVKGKPVKTFVSGKLVMDNGEIVAEAGCGRIIRKRRLE